MAIGGERDERCEVGPRPERRRSWGVAITPGFLSNQYDYYNIMEIRTTANDHLLPCFYAPLLPVPRLRHLYTNRSWLRRRVFIGGGKDDLLGVGVDRDGVLR